jgi:hypothetical protein
MDRAEAKYQRELIERIEARFPGCYVTPDLKQQGLPDLLILFGDRWALLEVKKSAGARHQANQDYYCGLFDGWSFCAVIYPENEEQVLNDLQSTFGTPRRSRNSQPKSASLA